MPDLGNLGIDKLTAKRIREWHIGVALAPKLLRTGKTADRRATRAVVKDPDAVWARRQTAF